MSREKIFNPDRRTAKVLASKKAKRQPKEIEEQRRQALEEWIKAKDPSEYRVPTPGEHSMEPPESPPDDYEIKWKMQHVHMPVHDDWLTTKKRKG